MRLDCSVLGVPLKGSVKPGKPAKGVVCIGKTKLKAVNGQQAYQLQVSTSKQRNQPAIALSGPNVQSFITTHAAAGKITLDFVTPPIRLFISGADATRLSIFVGHLQKILKGEEPAGLDQVKPVKSTEIQVPRKLEVDGSTSYHSDYARSFPTTLQRLLLTNCGLSRVDVRWFANTQLTQLSLAGNLLGSNSKELAKLRLLCKLVNLHSLDLSSNGLETLPDDAAFPPHLAALMLQSNRLQFVPQSVRRITSLVLLDLSSNPLTSMPPKPCWPRLTHFYINDTSIAILPYYLMRWQFQEFRCSGRPNPPYDLHAVAEPISSDVPSLEVLAACAVRQHQQPEYFLPWTVRMPALTAQCIYCTKWLPPTRLIHSLGARNAISIAARVDTHRPVIYKRTLCPPCSQRRRFGID